MSYVIAKQPIYDREGNIYAYEVYLRKKDSPEKYPEEVPFSKAAYIVTEIITELGVEKVSERKKIVVNVSLETILNKAFEILPFEKIIFSLNPPEVPIGETVYKKIIERIKELRSKGSIFILDESIYSGKYKDVLNLCEIIEFKVKNLTREKANTVKNYGKKLLVSMIEKEDEYKTAFELGADYFEGNYFSEPIVIKDFELAPFLKVTVLRLMNALSSAKSLKEFANIIASDVGMTVKFLKFVNSAYFARRKKIEDLNQAVAYIGTENIKRFVLLLALNDFVKIENPKLWKKSLIRAYIMEELVKNYNPQLAEKAFLVGLFSLLDEILHVDKVQFLRDLNVDEEIIKAFEEKNGVLNELLKIAVKLEEAVEKGNEELDKVAEEIAQETGLHSIDLIVISKDAKAKAESVLKI